MEIEFVPDLSHCIQTLAKKKYEDIKSQLIENDSEKPNLGEQLELLKDFLESTDFNKLRSEYEPYLIQGKFIKFTLYTEASTTKHRMEIE